MNWTNSSGTTTNLDAIHNTILERVMVAAQTDPVVAEQFLGGVGRIDPLALLLRPAMMLRIVEVGGQCHGHRRPIVSQSVQPPAHSG